MPHVWGPALRVADLARSIEYYTGLLGMQVVGRFGDEQFDQAVLSYGVDFDEAPCVALISHRDPTETYERGGGFLRLVLVVDDVASICGRVPEWGCKVIRAPKESTALRKVVAMVSDPDGYVVELVQHL